MTDTQKPDPGATDMAPEDNGEAAPPQPEKTGTRAKEIGGRKGPEPTRYGDWEKNGIISDF